MVRIFFFLLGFGLIVVGLTNLVLLLNLFSVGYSARSYFNYIFSNSQIYIIIIGIAIVIFSVIGGKKDELYL